MTDKTSATHVYDTFGRMLERLTASEGFAFRLRQMDQTIRFDLSEPDAAVVVTLLRDQPLSVDLGSSRADVDTVVRMSSVTASDLLLGEINAFAAIDSGEMEIEGRVRDYLAVFPQVAAAVSPIYRAMLEPPEHTGAEEIAGPPAVSRGAEGDRSSDGSGLR